MKKSPGYEAFLAAQEQKPSPIIHEQLRALVARDLNPSIARVGFKVAGLHLLAALLSLTICPQFGIGPFGGDVGLMAFLMTWGWVACAMGCGTAFMAGTGFLSALILTPDEKRVFTASSGWIFTSLTAASWGVLMITRGGDHHSGDHHVMSSLSPEIFSTTWSMIWAGAATGSAWLTYQISKLIPH